MRSPRDSELSLSSLPAGNALRLPVSPCAGGSSAHGGHADDKLFVGVSDIAQLSYCQVQATLSQLESQDGYRNAAAEDDLQGGVHTSSTPALAEQKRALFVEERRRLLAKTPLGWEDRRLLGRITERLELGSHETQRRHFDLGDFYVIGVPDALQGEVAVEFGASNYAKQMLLSKEPQANIYATLWEKPRYRVLVMDQQTGELLSAERAANAAKAAVDLRFAWNLMVGRQSPQLPSHPAKCKSCRYNRLDGCPVPTMERTPDIDQMRSIAARKMTLYKPSPSSVSSRE